MLLSCASALPVVGQTVIDRIVAVVDREIIMQSELEERIQFAALQTRMDPNDPELREDVFEALIAEKLVLAQALIDSIVVTDEEVTRALDQQLENLVRRAGSQERLEQIYGMPMSRIRRESRDMIRKQLLVMRVRQAREATIQITRREVEEFYEAYKDTLPIVPEEFELSHILIVPKPDASIEAQMRAKLAAIRDSIRAGGRFEDFARRYSHDGSAAAGGDLGWAKRGDYVREFEEAVFSLRPNEISDIVKTQFGLHLIQLLERRGESVHARHILLRVEKGPASDSAAIRQLQELRQRALAGESFAELARKYSEDEETKVVGGDLGRMPLNQMDEAFASVVRDLKEGDISEPHRINFQTSYGYQIVHVRRRIPEHPMNLTDDYRRVEQIALQFKRLRLNNEWIDNLKRTIYWEVRN
jgi:peptidyl-prolyl cis-trans isomerase SurA